MRLGASLRRNIGAQLPQCFANRRIHRSQATSWRKAHEGSLPISTPTATLVPRLGPARNHGSRASPKGDAQSGEVGHPTQGEPHYSAEFKQPPDADVAVGKPSLDSQKDSDFFAFFDEYYAPLAGLAPRSRKHTFEALLDEPMNPGHYAAGTAGFTTWRWLSEDHERMRRESTPPEFAGTSSRLIDMNGADTDMELWSCLISFCHRTDYTLGTTYLLQELFRRRRIFETNTPQAASFWSKVLDVSIHDHDMLTAAWHYAEWMSATHGMKWPELYKTILLFFLRARDLPRASQWHHRLRRTFLPSEPEFGRILTETISDPNKDVQKVLKSIYLTSRHRGLYDTVVSFLWSHGQADLAREWRRKLVANEDLPSSASGRPFLRYLAKNYPGTLLREELLVAWGEDEIQPGAPHSMAEMRTMINSAYGKTFGIQEKIYNDNMGAKWFATSWLSLDFAIEVVHTLGVKVIGPLSLQSISLREGTPEGVLSRIQQLRGLGIDIGSSQYAMAVEHLAKEGNNSFLQRLLHSDIHPDVFDDLKAKRSIMHSCMVSGHWTPYHILVSGRITKDVDPVTISYNDLLETSLYEKRHRSVFRLLDEIEGKGLVILPPTSVAISNFIIRSIPLAHGRASVLVRGRAIASIKDVDFAIALARRMMDIAYPLRVHAWDRVLRSLSFRYQFDELEHLSQELIKRYASARESDEITRYMHEWDIPAALRDSSEQHQRFQRIPRDFPLDSPGHPIHKLFSLPNFQLPLIRRTVRAALIFRRRREQDSVLSPERLIPADFSLARGIRFLSMIKEAGIRVPTAEARNIVLFLLVDLYGSNRAPKTKSMQTARAVNRLTLGDARILINEAWGWQETLLPGLESLKRLIDWRTTQRRHIEKRRQLKWNTFLTGRRRLRVVRGY